MEKGVKAAAVIRVKEDEKGACHIHGKVVMLSRNNLRRM
jgi:hypothetical protein